MARPLSTALANAVVDWPAPAWPLRWPAVFGREAPLVLEIGFGNGQFLADEARAHPERDHVGIELSWSAATRLFKRIEKNELTNVRALLMDAEAALANLFAPESLSEVFVNHPCPWPKARHVARRLLQPSMLTLLTDRMRMGAKLTVVTDHAEYAGWVAENLQGQDALHSCHPTVEIESIPQRTPTKYERKAMAQGIPIHYFEWEKRSAVDAPPPVFEDGPLEMPSLTLRGPHEASRLLSELTPRVVCEDHRGVNVVVRLGDVYRPETGDGWLVEVLLKEDQLRQEFGLLVVPRGENELLVKLSGLGRPHPTHGVKRAVWSLGRWLVERHPGLEVVHENLGAEATAPVDLEREGG